MNNSEVIISPATDGDAYGIQFVLKEASRKMYLDCGYSVEDFEERFKDSLTDESVLACVKNISSLSGKEIFLVARLNNEVVAIAYIERSEDSNILHALYVLPEFQGKGIGWLLWNDLKDLVDLSKDTSLRVFSCNKSAIDFYKKIGFVLTGNISVDPYFQSTSGVDIEEIEMILRGVGGENVPSLTVTETSSIQSHFLKY